MTGVEITRTFPTSSSAGGIWARGVGVNGSCLHPKDDSTMHVQIASSEHALNAKLIASKHRS